MKKLVFGSAVHGCGEHWCMAGCSAGQRSASARRRSPMATNAPTNSPMATAEATVEPSPAATAGATDMTPAQAGKLAEKIAQAVQQISRGRRSRRFLSSQPDSRMEQVWRRFVVLIMHQITLFICGTHILNHCRSIFLTSEIT